MGTSVARILNEDGQTGAAYRVVYQSGDVVPFAGAKVAQI